jgi:cyclopropane-fatty-acyl-phospholipid synthase
MVYSCAYFENGDEDLATAQRKKIDHILTKIGVQPGQTLLDIGCGWGALVIRAAQKFGARCVGVTLSENQASWRASGWRRPGCRTGRDPPAGLPRRRRPVRPHHQRRHVRARRRAAPADYFEPHQQAAGAGRRRDEPRHHHHRRRAARQPYGGGEFIDQYVFPHGELAHLSTVIRTMQEGGLEVRDVENLRRHYARTCALWTENFENRRCASGQLADPKTFRIWHVYLAGCAYAFRARLDQPVSDRVRQGGRGSGADAVVAEATCTRDGCVDPALTYLAFYFIREGLAELRHLGRHHEGAIALQRVLREVVLVIVLGLVPGLGSAAPG